MVPGLYVFMRVFDHDHGRIDHGADGNRDASQGHDVGVDTLPIHDRESGQMPSGKLTMATSGGA